MTDPLAKPATKYTKDANSNAAALINFDDDGDFRRAQQGLIATHETGRIELDGRAVWDTSSHDFLREGKQSPETVHPGLWRQGQLNALHGLFEVAEGVWQARGYDISNITFIETSNGWLIIDPLTTSSTAVSPLQITYWVSDQFMRSFIHTAILITLEVFLGLPLKKKLMQEMCESLLLKASLKK